MKIWQKAGLILVAATIILGAGYVGFSGGIPSLEKHVEETDSAPPTVAVQRGDVKKTIISPGTLINTKTVEISSGLDGKIIEVNVQPGDSVEEGKLLVKLDGGEQARIDLANAELNQKNAQTALDIIYSNAEMKQAEALKAISEAEAAVEGLDSQHELKLAEALKAVADAKNEVLNAEYRLSSLGAPINQTALAAAKADLTLARQTLKDAEKVYSEFAHKNDKDINKAHAQRDWAAAKQAYDSALARVNFLTGEPTPLNMDKANADLLLAKANLTLAEEKYALLSEGLTQADRDIAEATLNQAKMAYNALNEGIDPEELAQAELTLAKAKLEVEVAHEKVESLEVKAPFDGVVLSVSVEQGQSVNTGSTLVKFADPHALEVSTSVVEEDYPLIEVGQEVNLYFDAVPGETTIGHIARLIPVRASTDRPLYQVFITIDDVPEKIVEGMTADTEIILDFKEDVLRLPRTMVKADPEGIAALKVWNSGTEVERKVQIGIKGDMHVEIVSGLEEGDLVIVQ